MIQTGILASQCDAGFEVTHHGLKTLTFTHESFQRWA